MVLEKRPLTGHMETADLSRTTEGFCMGPLGDDRLTVKTCVDLDLGGLRYCKGPAGSHKYTIVSVLITSGVHF